LEILIGEGSSLIPPISLMESFCGAEKWENPVTLPLSEISYASSSHSEPVISIINGVFLFLVAVDFAPFIFGSLFSFAESLKKSLS
jgi:hypothetical protein